MISKPQQNFKGWVGHSTLDFAYDGSIYVSIQLQGNARVLMHVLTLIRFLAAVNRLDWPLLKINNERSRPIRTPTFRE